MEAGIFLTFYFCLQLNSICVTRTIYLRLNTRCLLLTASLLTASLLTAF